MGSIKWSGVACFESGSRVSLHFFPAAVGVSAPYPCGCCISLRGNGIQERPAMIEGARLGHPDGLFLDDVFPSLKTDAPQFAEVCLEIESQQVGQRVDLSASQCIIEIASRARVVRYRPRVLSGADNNKGVLALRDAFRNPSLVVVNGTAGIFRPEIRATIYGQREVTGEPCIRTLDLERLPPNSVKEISLNEDIFVVSPAVEAGWGVTRGVGLEVSAPTGEDVSYFFMERDLMTRAPLSMVAL